MRFHRRLGGGEPLVMDVPVYDAGALVVGELMMAAVKTGAAGHCFITSTGATGEQLGVLQEAPADSTLDASSGFSYAKCIVSPDATYLAEYFQNTGNVITSGVSASTSTTITISSLEDDIDSGWLYLTDKVTAGVTGAGQLRYISASAAGSCTVLATTVGTDSEIIKIAPPLHHLLDADSPFTGLESAAAAGAAARVMNIENYIFKRGRTNGIQPLRKATHDGLNNLNQGGNPKFYSELVMLEHALRVAE